MLQIQGVKGEAVVYYRELLTRLRQGFGVPGEMQVELAKARQGGISSAFPNVGGKIGGAHRRYARWIN